MEEYIVCACGSKIKNTPSNVCVHKTRKRHLNYEIDKIAYSDEKINREYPSSNWRRYEARIKEKKAEYNRRYYMKKKHIHINSLVDSIENAEQVKTDERAE
jgi:hypothetical protein